MLTHPSERLWSEVVRIASNLHWQLDSILDLEHPVRQRVLAHVEAIAHAEARPDAPRPAAMSPGPGW